MLIKNELKLHFCKLTFKILAEASFEGAGGRRPPPRKKEQKKEKRKKRKKRKKKEGNYMNNVKLLYIKCCFFQFFNSQVALKNKKFFGPQEKVEMTPLDFGLDFGAVSRQETPA